MSKNTVSKKELISVNNIQKYMESCNIISSLTSKTYITSHMTRSHDQHDSFVQYSYWYGMLNSFTGVQDIKKCHKHTCNSIIMNSCICIFPFFLSVNKDISNLKEKAESEREKDYEREIDYIKLELTRSFVECLHDSLVQSETKF